MCDERDRGEVLRLCFVNVDGKRESMCGNCYSEC